MLEIDAIDTFYGETQALFGASIRVNQGEAVALLGPNGAGKTTMLRSILGLTPARRGAIRFGGKEITKSATHDIARAGIGWVPDDRRIFPALKVKTNLALGKKRTPFRSWSEKNVYELFPALEYLLDRESENLSGGEMQMVAIGRALLGGPGLILLDEPSQGLAPKLVQDVMKTIARLKSENMGVLVVEQNVRSVLAVCDRVYVVQQGRVVHEGPAEALLEDEEARTKLLGDLNVQPILQVQGLKKIYTRGFLNRKQTFSISANFSVAEPQIVGVMGPNGSGKTTLFEMLSGSNIPTSGKVLCAGQDVHKVKYRDRDRMVIHYHQSYQVRRVKKTVPSFMLEPPRSDYPLVHVFDEPQFSTQDGYIGFMLKFFRHLRANGRVVFLCLHPNEPFHVDIMRKNCERYLFVSKGQVAELPNYDSLLGHPGVREYLGVLADL